MSHGMRPSRFHSQDGFTMIELLVVTIVIGILSAIALPAFASQSHKANDAEAKSVAKQAQLAAQIYFTGHDTYDTTLAVLRADDPSLASGAGTTLSYTGQAAGFELSVMSSDATKFTVRRTSESVELLCDQPGQGGCGTDGHW